MPPLSAPRTLATPVTDRLDLPSLCTLTLVLAMQTSAVEAQDGQASADDPATASASAPSTPAESESPSPVVRALLVEAVAEYDAGHYAEAQALFRRAHELAPSARTLRGLGMAAFELRQYTTALRAFEEALASHERPLTDEQRAHVSDLLERARVFVSTVIVRLTPPDAVLRVDGTPAALDAEGRLRLDPGAHTFDVEHPSHLPRRYEIQLEPGTERDIEAVLEPRPAPAPRPAAPRDDTLLVVGAVSGVTALLATLGATITGVVAMGDAEQLRRECDGFVCPGELEPARDRARTLALATDALGATSAVLGATAVGLLVAGALTGGGSGDTSVAFSCHTEGCALSVGGRW
jgi:hypothetical protein